MPTQSDEHTDRIFRTTVTIQEKGETDPQLVVGAVLALLVHPAGESGHATGRAVGGWRVQYGMMTSQTYC